MHWVDTTELGLALHSSEAAFMDGSHRTPHSVLGIAELQHHAAQSLS